MALYIVNKTERKVSITIYNGQVENRIINSF
jgi:hypothetical protein